MPGRRRGGGGRGGGGGSGRGQGSGAELPNTLHAAAVCGDLPTVRRLLNPLGEKCNPNRQDAEGRTPLFLAAVNGHVQILRLFLKAGAHPNTPEPVFIIPTSL